MRLPALLAFLVLSIFTSQAQDETTLTGKLRKLSKNGNVYLAIELAKPVSASDMDGEKHSSSTVQIAGLDEAAWAATMRLAGKNVTCTGTLATAETRYHYTPVLIVTASVREMSEN